MSHFWLAKNSRDYDKRDYKSILSQYSGDELRKILDEGVSHIHIKAGEKEVERPISASEKTLLCSIMYSTVLSIKFCDITTSEAIYAGEYTANVLFEDILHTDLQGYLSYFIPMWEYLDYLALKGKEYEIEDGVLIQYHGKEEYVVIPDGVTEIGEEAFEFNDWVRSVSIPDSVSVIGKKAFRACHNLRDISIPDSVSEIGNAAFELCKSLESVSIPNGVTSLNLSLFSECTNLRSISIPNSVTEIGFGVFMWCESLESITIPNGVTKIGNSLFYKCKSLKSVTIPDSVTSIGRWAFENCSSLNNVIIPDSVTEIGEDAFCGCPFKPI